jgi:putative heme-binding domain-containing protein
MRFAALVLFVVVVASTFPAQLAAQPKQYPPDLVAPTDALSPAEERKAFTLPAGFDMQLVAAEPDIQKPMQMAFDAKGRLWVTTSYHYPFAAPQGKGTDKLFVLSDIDPATGKAGKVQVFASDLNIPIGVLPLPDGKSVLVSSVGEIRKYRITEGPDGPKSGGFEVLFSGFGYRDTHGMYNSFTLMPDGWVYACHGFANDSKVKGKDGHEVVMNSGHTFRFRPDGSRIEVYTRGQVNPFGMAVDPWFNLYTADCHSKPITQLIPGAYYDSFGKPHDGLGYGPHVTRHDHGSTGLCGVAWYDGDHFPKDYLGCMFVGNVVTNRINFDKIEWKGASPVAKELPDFLVSKDRWFRPVDIKLGPDGALYVADFYNKIIGHYEVDLRHPGRDKDRGRLWRIVWRGEPGASTLGFPPKMPFTDLTTATADELGRLAEHGNMTTKLLVAQQLRARFPDEAKARYPERTRQQALQELADFTQPQLQRKAADYVTLHPHAEFVKPLIELLKKTPADDTHLRHAARIALRNCLRDAVGGWAALSRLNGPTDVGIAAEVIVAIPTRDASKFLIDSLRDEPNPPFLLTIAEHAGRWGEAAEWQVLTTRANGLIAQGEVQNDARLFAQGVALNRALCRGLQAGGRKFGRASELNVGAGQSTLSLLRKDPATARLVVEMLELLPLLTDDVWHVEGGTTRGSTRGLSNVIRALGVAEDVRGQAMDALARLDPKAAPPVLVAVMRDEKDSPAARERALTALARVADRGQAQEAFQTAIKATPYRVMVAAGLNMAGTKSGAEELLAVIKAGVLPARLLQERVIVERLRAAKLPELDQQIAALTKGLPALDQKLADLIKQRTTAFATAKPDKELGAKLFTKHCAACHRIGDQGGKIAPQLDGIGIRGLERLLEDTLDPNRNVDQAFRARIITTTDDRTLTGLLLRVEGEVLVLADAEGKEIRIPTQDIATNRETMLSPMPANFGEAIPEADFVHLLGYLLDQKVPEPPKK